MMMQATEKLVGEGLIINPKRTEQPPKIDGKLDDPAWQGAPTANDPFISYTPVYGEVLGQKTEVWVTYDYDNLYFAFYCHDTEPDKIKTSVSRRDSILGDDWVGVDMETMGNSQFAYILLCNANGIQGDLLASFTLIPGTVVHLGYGSLHQKQYWDDINQQWDSGVDLGKFYQNTQSLFFKVSYLYRF